MVSWRERDGSRRRLCPHRLAGSAGLGHNAGGWRRRTSLVAAAELALPAGVAAGWRATHGRPGPSTALLPLAVAAAAIGMQSALTISSGVRGAAGPGARRSGSNGYRPSARRPATHASQQEAQLAVALDDRWARNGEHGSVQRVVHATAN
jgi:hypothetical protein